VKYLLDVNVLVAWGWKEHSDHDRVTRWIEEERNNPATEFLTAPIPELGFVRVSVQRTSGAIGVKAACAALDGMLAVLGPSHIFIADNLRGTRLPPWCNAAVRTTDAHLVALAQTHDATLATLDMGIPGAFIIPTTGEAPTG
jgi:predicted nucleic acid-binding protein